MKDLKNPLLNRREVQITIKSGSNPGFQKSQKMLAEQLHIPEEQVAVRGVYGKFGSSEFLIDALVYNSVKDKERFEPKKKEKKKAAEGGK